MTVQRLDTNALLAQLTPQQIALVPKRDLTLVQVAEKERAVVDQRNEPTTARSTRWRAVWMTESVKGSEGSVAAKVMELCAIGIAELTADELARLPASDAFVVELGEFERAVVCERGRRTR